jgi:small GTP-binding protein
MLSSELQKLLKVSIVGAPAVGKTTMLKLLSGNVIDKLYLPTHGLDLKTVRVGDFITKIWDFAGQEGYLKTYSSDHLLGTDLLFVVTDSSPRNVLRTRELINYAAQYVGKDCPIVAIANKQDLQKNDGRMDPRRVEEILNIKTYGLTAVDPAQRTKLLDIIRKELNKISSRKRLKEIEL